MHKPLISEEWLLYVAYSDFSSLNQTVNIISPVCSSAAGKRTVFPGMDALRLSVSIFLQRYHYHPPSGFRV